MVDFNARCVEQDERRVRSRLVGRGAARGDSKLFGQQFAQRLASQAPGKVVATFEPGSPLDHLAVVLARHVDGE